MKQFKQLKENEKELFKKIFDLSKNQIKKRKKYSIFHIENLVAVSLCLWILFIFVKIIFSVLSQLQNLYWFIKIWYVISFIVTLFLLIYFQKRLNEKNKKDFQEIMWNIEQIDNFDDISFSISQYRNRYWEISNFLKIKNNWYQLFSIDTWNICMIEFSLIENNYENYFLEIINNVNKKNIELIKLKTNFEKIFNTFWWTFASCMLLFWMIYISIFNYFIKDFILYSECWMNFSQNISMKFKSNNSKEIVREYCSEKIKTKQEEYEKNKLQTILQTNLANCSYSKLTEEEIKEKFNEQNSSKIIKRLNKECSIEILKRWLDSLNLNPNLDFEKFDNVKDVEDAINTIQKLQKLK